MTPAASAASAASTAAADFTFTAAASTAAPPRRIVQLRQKQRTSPHLSPSLSRSVAVAAMICPTMSHPPSLPPSRHLLSPPIFSLCLLLCLSIWFKYAVRRIRPRSLSGKTTPYITYMRLAYC